jgi:lysophospholipase L1-like esterase
MPSAISEFKLNPLDGSTTVEYSDGAVTTGSILPASTLTADDTAKLRAGAEWLTPFPSSNAFWGQHTGRKLLVWGDSIANQNGLTSGAYLGGAWVPLGLYYAGNPLDLVGVGGNSGLRTDQIIPTFAAQVAALSPDYVVICAGTNDLAQGLGATAALNGLMTMAALVESIGATPILMTLPPGETYVSASQAIRDSWVSFNAQVKAICADRRYPLLDAMHAYLDESSPLYAPLPGHTDGAVHPYSRGAQAIGMMLGELLRGLPRRSLFNPQTVAANVCTNPLLTGAGGTIPGGFSGSAPTGCQLSFSGGSGASSVVARADGGPGNWWQVAMSGSVAGNGADLIFPAASLATAGLAVGDVCRFVLDAEIDDGHSGVLCLNAGLRFLGTSNWSYAYSAQSSNGSLRPGAQSLQFRVPEFVIPAGTTSLGLYLRVSCASGAVINATVRAGAVSGGKVV